MRRGAWVWDVESGAAIPESKPESSAALHEDEITTGSTRGPMEAELLSARRMGR